MASSAAVSDSGAYSAASAAFAESNAACAASISACGICAHAAANIRNTIGSAYLIGLISYYSPLVSCD